MSRHFPNFLDAYMDYSRDGFVPDKFHYWAGLSLIAACLERKVELRQKLISYVPNIYVMLVSPPKGGKTTAIERAHNLIEDMRADHCPNFRLIANQTNEATLIKRLMQVESVPIGLTGKFLVQSPGYFIASEASDSALKNSYGDFNASMTALYDCPRIFRKDLSSMAEPAEISHPCMNMLAGTTFDFLKRLVNVESVGGGFASRMIYVVESEQKVRVSSWGEEKSLDAGVRRKLVDDLAVINKLMGPMQVSKEWKAQYNEWQPKWAQEFVDLGNEKMQGIYARKDTNLVKVSILLAIADGDSMMMEGKHFEKALNLIDDAYKDNAHILASAVIADKTSQSGLNQLIGQTLKKNGGSLPITVLRAIIIKNGNDLNTVDKTIEYMLSSHLIALDGNKVKIIVDPNTYF